jgi:hypothetical protein
LEIALLSVQIEVASIAHQRDVSTPTKNLQKVEKSVHPDPKPQSQDEIGRTVVRLRLTQKVI